MIDSNLQNICDDGGHPPPHTREEGVKAKSEYAYTGGTGGGGLSVCTLRMTPTITGFLNFIFDVFQAGHILYCRAKRKICALCFLESKIIKEKATQYNI